MEEEILHYVKKRFNITEINIAISDCVNIVYNYVLYNIYYNIFSTKHCLSPWIFFSNIKWQRNFTLSFGCHILIKLSLFNWPSWCSNVQGRFLQMFLSLFKTENFHLPTSSLICTKQNVCVSISNHLLDTFKSKLS